MQERASEIRGRIGIQSVVNRGTKINFYMPLIWEERESEDEIDVGR